MHSSLVMLGFVTRLRRLRRPGVLGALGGLGVLGVLVGFPGCSFSARACEPGGSSPDTCPIGNDVDLTLSGSLITYDTVTHELEVDGTTMPVTHRTVTTQAGEVDAVVAHDVRLTAGAQLRATGLLPFVIVAGGSITLEDGASIDVSNGGAGALPACPTPPMPGAGSTGGGAGGGGAGHGAGGGKGGNGNGNKNGQPAALTMGGTQGFSISLPAGPMGGCPGAPGGKGEAVGDMNGAGGAGGAGGGAVYLVAADRIGLGNMATLTAGGGGGRGGGQRGGSYNSGGGGGGSGGMILLESPHVIGLQAQIAANGGGGGEGADLDQNPPYTPHPGRDGTSGSTSTSRALGGTGGASGGADGGRGGSLESPVGEAVTAMLDGGGGGGGGGVGFIHVVSSDFQVGTVSPAVN